MTCGDIFRIIIALFIPPLGVFTQVGATQLNERQPWLLINNRFSKTKIVSKNCAAVTTMKHG